MTGAEAISAIGLSDAAPQLTQLGIADALRPATQAASGTFHSVLSAGLEAVDSKIAHADQLVRQFAVDDSVPVHQVTIALEEARLSVELAMQMRTRMVEAYRELMNMQL